MPSRALWLALPVLALACASPAPRRGARAEAPAASGVARGRFEPGEVDDVFRRAVRTVRDTGYAVEACDAGRRTLATSPREFDGACGAGSCLSRQSIAIVLGHRGARVTVAREVFDGALRAWTPADSATLDGEAQALLQKILPPQRADAAVTRRPDDEAAAPPRPDPCASVSHADATPAVQPAR